MRAYKILKKNRNGYIAAIFCGALILLTMMYSASASASASQNKQELFPDYSQTRQQATNLINELLDDYNGAGIGVVLVDNDRAVWCDGFGYADKERNILTTCDTVFRLGTASSVFTTLATLQLAEKIKLNIKSPVKSYLPDFQIGSRFENKNKKDMTLHSIMSNHSGLPSGILYGKWSSMPSTPGNFSELVKEMKHHYRVLPPDEIFTRSDVAMNILGEIISRRGKKEFSGYMSEHIFKPLGMRSSGFKLAPYFSRRLAAGYRLGKKQVFYYDRDMPASGLFSSPGDIGLFLSEVLSGNRLLKRSLIQSTWQQQNKDIHMDLGMPVGLGWVLGAFGMNGLGPVAHYSGDSLFQRCQIVILPKLKIGIAVMANNWKSREMVDSLARDILLLAIEDKFGYRPGLTEIPKQEIGQTQLEENMRKLTGWYATWRGLISVYQGSNNLKLDMGDRTLYLLPWSGNNFKMQYRLFGFIPINIPRLNHILLSARKIRGRQIMVANYRGSDFVFGEKLTPSKLTTKWRQRLGNYKVLRQDEVMKIENLKLLLHNNNLVLEYDIPDIMEDTLHIPISILSDNKAVVAGLGQGLGETLIIKENQNGVTHIWMSGYEAVLTGF